MKLQAMLGMILVSVTLISCSGQIYTVTGAQPTSRGDDGKYRKGITAYPPKLYVENYVLTAYVVDGKILNTVDGKATGKKCEPGLKQSIVTRPDYSSPYDLVYEPGFLESKEFGVTLKDGMVTNVNIKGTPDRGETVKNVLSPIAEVAGSAFGIKGEDGKVLCNASPILKEIVPYETK